MVDRTCGLKCNGFSQDSAVVGPHIPQTWVWVLSSALLGSEVLNTHPPHTSLSGPLSGPTEAQLPLLPSVMFVLSQMETVWGGQMFREICP